MPEPYYDERNHWPKGLVRHLRLDPECDPHQMRIVRVDHDGGINAGGSTDIYYTLVLSPDLEGRIEELRRRAEADPNIGGLFSPERDL